MTFSEILNYPAKSMGHGFVLAMLLTDDDALQECELRCLKKTKDRHPGHPLYLNKTLKPFAFA